MQQGLACGVFAITRLLHPWSCVPFCSGWLTFGQGPRYQIPSPPAIRAKYEGLPVAPAVADFWAALEYIDAQVQDASGGCSCNCTLMLASVHGAERLCTCTCVLGCHGQPASQEG